MHLTPVLLGLVANLSMLWGVTAGGWAPGNLWITLLAESWAVGALVFLRLKRTSSKKSFDASFWALWYGTFTLAATGIGGVAAGVSGVAPDLSLVVPLALLLVRTGVDAIDTQQLPRDAPVQLTLPITRMLVIHVGVIAGLGLALGALEDGTLGERVFSLGGIGVTRAALTVVVLLALKTVAELVVGLLVHRRARRPA